MTDLASLVLAIDSTQVKTGTASLDGLTAAGARAEAATVGLGRGAKTAGAAATAMAAEAQVASRAAVGMAGGAGTASLAMATLGKTSHASSLQIRESLVLMREASVGNFTRMAGSASLLGGSLATTGSNVGTLAKQLLTMVGILKVTQDAELAEAATQAAASAASIEAYAQRAAGAIAAADTELALAEAAVRVATTSEAEAAAQAQLAAAHEGVAAAAAQAAIAEDALAVAQGRAAETAAASSAATRTMIGGTGVGLLGLAVVAGVAYGAFKQFQDQVRDSGQLDKFAEGLRLTDEQIRKAGGSVTYLADRTRQVTGLTVTFGDVIHGVFQEIGKEANNGSAWDKFKGHASDAFSGILDFWNKTSAALSAGLWTIGNIAKDVFQYIGQKIGQSFYDGVNKAIDAVNSLNASIPKWLGGGDGSLIPHLVADKTVADLGSLGATIRKQADKNYADALAANKAAYAGIEKAAIEHREKLLQIESDANKPAKDKAAKKEGDHGLAEALALLDAQIKGELALAAAYQVSDVAAIKAEAMQKAEEQAIRHKGDTALFYEKELALAVASRAADGAKTIADIHAEIGARAVVNDLVEQGIIPVQRMGQALDEQMKKRALTAALAIAEEKGWLKQAADLRDEIVNLTFSQGLLNDELATEAALRQVAANSDSTAQLKKEAELIGASNRARAVALAQLEAEKFIRDNNITDAKQIADVTQSYIDQANATVTLAEGQNNWNASLTATLDMLKLIEAQAQTLGQVLSDAFGGAGDSIGKAINALASYQSSQQEISDWAREEKKKAGTDAVQLANIEAQAQQKSKNVQLQAVTTLLEAGKSLFKQHSAGYKAMEAAEKAFAIVQAISTIKSVAAGAAKMFSQLGVWAFPAVAAMIAVMAGLGFSGGSSSQTAPTSADDLQKAAGTGTVLGDSTAKSASIANSLEIMSKNSTKALDYSDSMVRALRNIESGIGDLTAAIARQLQLQGGFFDTTGKLGTSSSGIQGLFGSTTTKSLYDQGITLNPATIEQILETGISGATYQVIEKVKKNSGFLGIGGSTKTSYQTSTGALDSDITSQMNAIIGQLYNSVVAAAKVLGLDVADALKTFQVEIGKISFKDLTGQQITDELNAVFSKIGDQMAGFAVAGLAQFQKAGEGLFETLMRLAKDYLTIDAALKSIGMTFGSVGASSIAARESLIDLAGGLDNFVSQVNFFYDHFLTGAAKLAMEQGEVNGAFAQMDVAAPKSIDAFTALVQGLNLSTDAGQQMFEALMQIAPAFYDVATAADALAKKQADLQVQLLQAQGDAAGALALQRSIALAALDPSLQELQKQIWATQDAASAAAAALKLENDRQNLQVQLLQAQGKTQQATDLQRKIALAALDPALRDLQKQVWKAQDATAAQAAAAAKLATAKDNLLQAYKQEADALQQTIDKFSKFATDLKAFRDSLFTGTDAQQSYSAALVELMKQAGLANAGDENALGSGLQDSAQKFIDIATANAHTLQDVERAKALVAGYLDQAIGSASGHATAAEQQLEQMKTQVGKLVDIDDHVLSVADAIKQLTALMFPSRTPQHHAGGGGVQGPTQHEKATQDKLDRIHSALEGIAGHAGKTARILDRADRGGAIALVTDADSPIKVTS